MSERGGGGVVGGLPPQLLSEEPLAPRAGDTVWNSDLGTHTLRTIFLSSAFFFALHLFYFITFITFNFKHWASVCEEAVTPYLTCPPISQMGIQRPVLAREPGLSLTELMIMTVINMGWVFSIDVFL